MLRTYVDKSLSVNRFPFMLDKEFTRLIAIVDRSKGLWHPSWPKRISVEAKSPNDPDKVYLNFKIGKKMIAALVINHGGAFGSIDHLEFIDSFVSIEMKKAILQYACYQIASRSGVKVIEVCSNIFEETEVYRSIGFYNS